MYRLYTVRHTRVRLQKYHTNKEKTDVYKTSCHLLIMEQADPVTAEGVVGVYFCPYKVKRSNVGDVCLVILSDAN